MATQDDENIMKYRYWLVWQLNSDLIKIAILLVK